MTRCRRSAPLALVRTRRSQPAGREFAPSGSRTGRTKSTTARSRSSSSRSMRLEGKVAIVTGAGSGIGKATAALFRSEGATVIGADVEGADVACDAGDEAQVEALIAQAVADHGGLDIVFANAG